MEPHDPADLRSSLKLYQQAVERDPGFGAAYAGMVEAYMILIQVDELRRDEALPEIQKATEQALAAAPGLAETHVAVSVYHQLTWSWAASEQALRHALDLNPSYAFAWMHRAALMTFLGRHQEALDAILQARALDPLNPWVTENVVDRYGNLHRYEEALAESDALADLNRDHFLHYWARGGVLNWMGRYAEAIPVLERAAELWAVSEPLPDLAFALARAGRRDEALAILAELEARILQGRARQYHLTWVHLGLGDRDAFFASFERAVAEHDLMVQFMPSNPYCDEVRDDPRFAELERRMGLPPSSRAP